MWKRAKLALPPYPYHFNPKAIVQELIDFPLQFYSESPVQEDENLHYFDSDALKAAKQSCQLFLSLLAKNQLQDLENICEWNLYQKLKKVMTNFKDQEYTIKTVGDLERSKLVYLGSTCHVGSLLPYRNLNLPKSNYKSTASLREWRDNIVWYETKYKFKDLFIIKYPWINDEIKSLDLKYLNTLDDVSSFEEDLKHVRLALYLRPIIIHSVDVGFISPFKLLIIGKDGNIVDGEEKPKKLEFHSFRIEKVKHSNWLFGRRSKWMKSNFKGILNEYIISDVDGLMNGNPFIK